MSDPSVVILGVTVISGVAVMVIRHLWSRSYGVRFQLGTSKDATWVETYGAETTEQALDGVEELIENVMRGDRV